LIHRANQILGYETVIRLRKLDDKHILGIKSKQINVISYIDPYKKDRMMYICKQYGKTDINQINIYLEYIRVIKRSVDNNFICLNNMVKEYDLSQADILYMLYKYALDINMKKAADDNINSIDNTGVSTINKTLTESRDKRYFIEKINDIWILNTFDGSNIFNNYNYDSIYGKDAFDSAIIRYISQNIKKN
jgi:hypothetical protein